MDAVMPVMVGDFLLNFSNDDINHILLEMNSAWKNKPVVDPTVLLKGKNQAKFEEVTLPENHGDEPSLDNSNRVTSSMGFQQASYAAMLEMNSAWKVKPAVDPTVLPKGKNQAKFEAVTLPENDGDVEQSLDYTNRVSSSMGFQQTSYVAMRLDTVDELTESFRENATDEHHHQAEAANITLDDPFDSFQVSTGAYNRFERFDIEGDEETHFNIPSQEQTIPAPYVQSSPPDIEPQRDYDDRNFTAADEFPHRDPDKPVQESSPELEKGVQLEMNSAWKVKPAVDPTVLPKGKNQAKFEAVTLPENDGDVEQSVVYTNRVTSSMGFQQTSYVAMRLDAIDELTESFREKAKVEHHNQGDAVNITLDDPSDSFQLSTGAYNRFERFDVEGDNETHLKIPSQQQTIPAPNVQASPLDMEPKRDYGNRNFTPEKLMCPETKCYIPDPESPISNQLANQMASAHSSGTASIRSFNSPMDDSLYNSDSISPRLTESLVGRLDDDNQWIHEAADCDLELREQRSPDELSGWILQIAERDWPEHVDSTTADHYQGEPSGENSRDSPPPLPPIQPANPRYFWLIMVWGELGGPTVVQGISRVHLESRNSFNFALEFNRRTMEAKYRVRLPPPPMDVTHPLRGYHVGFWCVDRPLSTDGHWYELQLFITYVIAIYRVIFNQ